MLIIQFGAHGIKKCIRNFENTLKKRFRNTFLPKTEEKSKIYQNAKTERY